jgi:DNA replication and repair protein RecF
MISSFAHSLQGPYVLSLHLSHFRCFDQKFFSTDAPLICVTGPNGSGKTSILEALSLLVDARGFRQASSCDLWYDQGNIAQTAPGLTSEGWRVASLWQSEQETLALEARWLEKTQRREWQLHHQALRSAQKLRGVVGALWRTPQMEYALLHGHTARRDYIDQLVMHVDPDHADRWRDYQKLLRERLALLQQGRTDSRWLAMTERSIAQAATAITAARMMLQGRWHAVMASEAMQGVRLSRFFQEGAWEERWGRGDSALALEEWLAQQLAENREHDRITKRTSLGPHRTEIRMEVEHPGGWRPWHHCSTGEQKAALWGMLLHEIALYRSVHRHAPIVLLDELLVHWDAAHRRAMLGDFEKIGGQLWMTHTESWEHLPSYACRIDLS